jgi:hypothetical protein
LVLKRSANKACAAGAAEGQTYRFRRPFFGSFFGRTKKEQIKTMNQGAHLRDELDEVNVRALLLDEQKE